MGVTYLLDTHVLLWLLGSPDRVAPPVRSLLADPASALLVSAATALEIATKVRLGKLETPALPATLPSRLAELSIDALPVSVEHALYAGSMDWDHRDPFDRLLVAQATLENATLVTVDRALTRLPVPRILTW